jgi:hypothetical protein
MPRWSVAKLVSSSENGTEYEDEFEYEYDFGTMARE